jgi:hypothetical protein
MIGGAKGIGIGIDFGIPNQYCRATSKPYIEKDVLDSLRVVASAYGKSNNDADRSIVKNLVDPDNPFVISNAAYDKMSSYGGYEFAKFDNTLDWYNTEGNDSVEVVSRNGHSITLKRLTGPNFWYFQNSTFRGLISNVIPFKVNSNKNITVIWDVHGLSISEGKDKSVRIQELVLNPNEDNYTNLKTLNEEELAQIDISTNSLYYLLWFDLSTLAVDEEVTIEMLPLFEGAFVTDGIDDLITSTKTVQEMLGGSNEITVVSMIHQVKDSSNNVSFTNYIRGSANGYFRNIVNNYDKTGIYGYTSSDLMALSVVNNILGDKNDYTSNGDNRDSIINGNFSVQGYSYNDGNNTGDFSSVAWYWTIIANKVLTTDQINQVIAYFNLDRTLNPDILCNTIKQGITNENHAEFGDKLIDFSGNGRYIQLNNLAWDGDSGIGKYNYPNWKVNVTQGNKYARIVYYDSINGTYSANFKGITDLYKSYGLSIEIRVNRANTVDFHSIKEDGIYTMTPPDDTTSIDIRFGGENVYNASCDITITQIPSHAGALWLDGVNDFGKVTGMPIYKDYTVVTDREIFANIGAILSKNNPGAFVETAGNSVYSFGQATSGLNFISTRSISYLSKYSYCGQSITAGAAEDGTDMWLGTIRDNDSRFFNGAIYSLMSFPYSMSEFLIERQLKKHKLGTLYPNMVEFRPIVKSNNKWDTIEIWQGDKSLYRPTVNDDKTGIYLKGDSTIGIYVKPYVGQKVSEIVYNGVSYTNLKLNSNGFYYKVVPITKSPQKITMTIEQDENYVLFNPVITSNVEYHKLDFYLNNYQKRINIGDYIPKGAYLRANFYLKNNVDELTVFTFNGVNIGYRRSSVDDTAFNISYIYNYDSPQEVNITIDEYIRYEDIVQPYPSFVKLENLDRTHTYTWGDKLKVGDIIRYNSSKNLLEGAYTLRGQMECNGVYVFDNNQQIVVTKEMVFAWSHSPIWNIDDNEPKCILSPRLLRIPNSSYKILGYIPDISGHGNHGVIHNSAYAEGSGVNEDGSYQFDGVDDFVTIPTLSSGGKQVLMKVNWNTINSIIYDQRGSGGFAIYCSDYKNPADSIIVPAYKGRNAAGTTYIDGIRNEYIIASQLRNVTHNIVEILDTSYAAGKINPIIGKSYMNTNYGSLALYDFMLFDNISTDGKIKELNEYIGIEAKVELPPYYWDAYGKTNLDEDKATIRQRGVAIGDYDLINNNFAYEGMSGYNGYPVVFGANKTWANESNGYVTSITSNTIHITNVLNAGLALLYSYVKYKGNLQNIKEIPPFKIEIKGLEGRSKFIYKYLATSDATKETNLYLGNGTHELPKSFLPTEALVNDSVVGFSISPIEEGVTNFLSDITIEVLPKYENGLVYDGVEDYSVNTNIPALTDYTYICKRTILNIPSNGATLLKGAHKTNGGAFIADYNNKWQFNFGQYNIIQSIPDGINWQTSSSFNGTSINRGTNTDDKGITIGRFSNGYANMVLYKLILYPKTIPLLQINFLKNLMERDEIIDLNNPIFIQ